MSKLKPFFLFFLFLPLLCFGEFNKTITFGWGGRLGDNILDYTHAKWLSYKYGIPLLLYTFEYSDQFVFYDVEKHLTPKNKSQYKEVKIESLSDLDKKIKENVLYFLPHACDSKDEYVFLGSYGCYVDVDWNDKTFRDMMRTLIAPKYPIKLITPPKDIISVALHYRTGGGFVWDTDSMKRSLPLRFPETEYYVEQLSKLWAIVNYEPIYVHLFTDHPEPNTILAMFRKLFPQSKIQFVCRENGNHHDANVLEDMFSMMNFDCLIRPMSHYSMTASHLGDFKIEFYPKHGVWEEGKFVVDNAAMIQKKLWDPVRQKWTSK